MSQLERLAKPFPDRLIHSNPSGGGSYVKHSVVTEKLLAVVGPFDFELVEIVRGHVPAIDPNPSAKSNRGRNGSPALESAVVGAVCRLSVVVDGVRSRIEEVGDCEDPHNWPHDGARLKDAMSDALKRAAMRLGVTLHLWSGPEFSLYEQLKNAASSSDGEDRQEPAGNRSEDNAAGPSAPRGPSPRSQAPTSTSGRRPVPEAEGTPSEPPVGPHGDTPTSSSSPQESAEEATGGTSVGANQLQRIKSKITALRAHDVPVADARIARGLPPAKEGISREDAETWLELLEQLEHEYQVVAP